MVNRMRKLRLTESQFHGLMTNIIKESIMLLESQESKSISQAKRLVMDRLGYNESEADNFVRVSLRNDLPVLRTPAGGKFILGAARMFCDGELKDAQDINNLNSTLKLVASETHINEYDRNLNGLSLNDLLEKFAKAISDNLEREKMEINGMQFNNQSDYNIVKINSFEDASEYSEYTTWCITHYEDMFESYTSNGLNQFYFCLKNGFEDVEPDVDDNTPLDEYGLSMIAVSVDENGALNTCTCRWNHDNGGNDSIMGTKEISQVIGLNFFDVFKPNQRWQKCLERVQTELANGTPLDDIFDTVEKALDGKVFVVSIDDRYNILTRSKTFLSTKWFSYATDISKYGINAIKVSLDRTKQNLMNARGELLLKDWVTSIYLSSEHEYRAIIYLNGKYNVISNNGELVSKEWFDNVLQVSDYYVPVEIGGKWNVYCLYGYYVCDRWYDYVGSYMRGLAVVALDGKENLINRKGNLVSEQWFDEIESPDYRGFRTVWSSHKCNVINSEGVLLSQQWLDGVEGPDRQGYFTVFVSDKTNLMTVEGKIVSPQWFDEIYHFVGGYARVKLSGKTNFIGTDGNLISDVWFEYAMDFWPDLNKAKVFLNGKKYYLNGNGQLESPK